MSNRQELEKKLIALFLSSPELFEEIEEEKYYSDCNPELIEDDLESLYFDGEAGLIEIEDKTYRFVFDNVAEQVGEEIYNW